MPQYGSLHSFLPNDSEEGEGKEIVARRHEIRLFREGGAVVPGTARSRLLTAVGLSLLLFVLVGVYALVPERRRVRSSSFTDAPSLAAIFGRHEKSDPELTPLEGYAASLDKPLGFTACNEYTCQGPPPTYVHPWLQDVVLVEPYRDTFFEVASPREGFLYEWTFVDRFGVEQKLMGSAVVRQFTELESHSVLLQEFALLPALAANGERETPTRSHIATVMCKYVRREIRSLTEADRNELMDAMNTLWKLPTADGRALYGPDYSDIRAFARFHHGGTHPDCDAFHGGLGFPISHFLITNLFERVVQLVNPKVCLPYWEYSIDDHIIKTAFDGDYTRLQEASPLFQSDWFGSADETDLFVKDGRWAWTKVETLSEEDIANGLLPNVYGMLRSPWSSNNQPYMVRGLGNQCGRRMKRWPSCSGQKDLIETPKYYDFALAIAVSHDYIHAFIGGVNDCHGYFVEMAELVGFEEAENFCGTAFYTRKRMWQHKLWGFNQTVPLTMPVKQALEEFSGCEQMGYDLDDPAGVEALLTAVMTYEVYVYDKSMDFESQRKLAKILCHTAFTLGDSLLTNGPIDPFFWVIHPTIERLTQVTLLAEAMDMTWVSETTEMTDETGETATFSPSFGTFGDECIGHRAYDVWPYLPGQSHFSTELYMFGEKKQNELTNLELTLALSPKANALPYIYDHFEWPHCEEEGLDLLEKVHFSAQRRPSRADYD